MRRTFRIRRVAAALALGIGGVAGVIGVTAGTAGANTVPTDTATGAAPTVTATQAAYTAAGVKITLGTAAISGTHAFTVPVAPTTNGTVDWTTATVVLHSGASGATLTTLTAGGTGTSTLTFTVPATATATDAHYVLIKPDTLTNHAAFGAIKASPSGATFTGGASVTIANGPSATVSTTKSTITATSAPSVPSTGTGNKAGTLVIKLHVGAGEATSTLTLHVAPGSGTVYWDAAHVTASGVTATETPATPTGASSTLTIKLSNATATATDTVDVTGITYNTVNAKGTITVTPTWKLATGGSAGTFTATHASAVNAVSTTPLPTTAPNSFTLSNLTARPIPPVGVGATGMPAGSWRLDITGAKTQGVGAGSFVQIAVTPHTGTNNCTATNAIAFDGTPTVSLTAKTTKNVTATPKFTTSLSGTGTGCSTKFAPNKLKISFTNGVKFTKTGAIVLVISGVKYSTAFKTTSGEVKVTGEFYASSTAKVGTKAVVNTNATNAIVSDAYVMANTPAVTMSHNAYDNPISPIDVVESVAGSVPKGYVCVTLAGSTRVSATGNKTAFPTLANFPSTSPNYFNTASKGTLKVTGGNGTASTLHFVTPKANTAEIVAFKVTAASSTAKPSTYVISGLAVNAATPITAFPVVTAGYFKTATCAVTTGSPTDNVAVAFVTTQTSTVIFGYTADATAAAELERAFPGTHGRTCPGTATKVVTGLLGQRPVVLARDNGYPDALASQYLASYLTTGTLLTPIMTLSTVTRDALIREGITHVYVVGGPLAVTTTVVAQIETTPVYQCGGNALTTKAGSEKFIQVTRIYGYTQYDTAQQIAQFVPKSMVAFLNLAGAYGKYNDTTGTSSPAPLTTGSLPTAILAQGQGFQDAESSSALAYNNSVPTLLTTPSSLSPQAKSAIITLGIKQVILMGGQLAVSNTVVTQLEALTVSVLRIAGLTYTDTAVQLADMEVGTTTGHVGLGWHVTRNHRLLVARGTFFTDGLAGAVLEHSYGTIPLLLTVSPSTVGAPLTTFLKKAGITGIDTTSTQTVHFLTVLGGPLAVNPATIAQMETDLKS